MARNLKGKMRSVEVRILQVSAKNKSNNDAAKGEKSPKKPWQSLHSVQIHLWYHSGGVRRHTASFYEIDKAFSRCVILPPGVSEHFPKVTFALLFAHLCQTGGYLPPTTEGRSVSMWRAWKLVCLGSSSVPVFIMGFSAYLLTLLCLFSPCTGRKHMQNYFN